MFFNREEKEKEERRKIERNNELNDVRRVLNTKEGVRLVKRILDRCGLHRQPAYRLGVDDRQTYIACGMLDIGLWLMDECQKSVENRDVLSKLIFEERKVSCGGVEVV